MPSQNQIRPVILSGVLIMVILLIIQCRNETRELVPPKEKWEKAIPHQQIPEGLTSLNAEQCGLCHQEHYEEWKRSTHSHAWTDYQFQAELKKESSPDLCVNCHIPLQNQQEFIVEGYYDGDIYAPKKRKNPHFDRKLQLEGITCASCHVRNNTVIGPTGSSKAPHATKKDKAFLSESLCISCHNASAVITPTLACTFETGNEWKNGPFYGEKNCIDCHMEQTEREVVKGYGTRKSRYHYFAGSGIPKTRTHNPVIMNGLSFNPSKLKDSYKTGDTIRFDLTLINEFAGHFVPTGDPERFIEIKIRFEDENGKILAARTDTIGEKWQWYPVAKKLADNNMAPGEKRNFQIRYTPTHSGKLKLLVEVKKHRLDQASAAYNKLGNEYPLFISIFQDTMPILVTK